jgi:hypothetical protein
MSRPHFKPHRLTGEQEMDKVEHVALPITVKAMVEKGGHLEACKVFFDANGQEIARIEYRLMETGSPGITHSDETAELIVRAVNCHAELIDGLRLAIDIIGHPDDNMTKYLAGILAKSEGK